MLDVQSESDISTTWAHRVKQLWDDGHLRNVYHDLAILRNACSKTMAYGRGNGWFPLEEHHKELFPDGCECEPPVDTDDLTGAGEPFDAEEMVPWKRVDIKTDRSFLPLAKQMIPTSPSWFVRTKRGFIGRTPSQPKVGDVVSVLLGGKVPFLLRPQTGSDCYRLVGEIYIHGIMKGAALKATSMCKEFVIV